MGSVTTRAAVIAAAKVDIAAITGVGLTGTVIKGYAEMTEADFPAVLLIDGATTHERIGYGRAMAAEMDLEAWLFVQDIENDISTKRTSHIAAVIKKLTAATLRALVDDVVEARTETDQVPNVGIARVTFTVKFQYDQAAP